MKLFYAIILGLMVLVSACAEQTEQKQPTEVRPSQNAADEAVIVDTKPSIVVNDQTINNGIITATQVTFDKPGFVVVHKVVDGTFGSVIGNSEVLTTGKSSNVEVPLTDYENENELIAMLHYDDDDGVYEFPGDDGPTVLDEQVVLAKFAVLQPEGSGFDVQVLGAGKFDPETLTIKSGDSVTWINADSGEAIIIIFKDRASYITSKKFSPGEQFEHEFTETGKYQYWRNIAFSSDGATITVE